MEAQLAEDYKCPICLEIPPNVINQCFEGHFVCGSCSKSLSTCPQCRGDMPTSQKIRNRALENILDKLKFPCPSEGCNQVLTRANFNSHSETCYLGGTRFKLCQLLGSSCQFSFNSRAVDSAFVHFKFFHKNCLVSRKSQGELRLPNLSNLRRDVNSIWTPLLFDLRGKDFGQCCFLMCISYNASTSSIDVSCLQLDESPHRLVFKLEIAPGVLFLVSNLVAKFRPLPVRHSEYILKKPSFSCPLEEILQNHLVNDSCNITWSIEDEKKPVFSIHYQISYNLQNLPPGDDCLDYLTPHTPADFLGDLCNCCDRSRSIYYKCLECEDWTVCLQCKVKGYNMHPNHCFAVIWNEAQYHTMNQLLMTPNGLVPYLPKDLSVPRTPSGNLTCSQCGKNAPIKYVCLRCPESSGMMCESCYLLRGHNNGHCIAVTENSMQVEMLRVRAKTLTPLRKITN